MAKGGEKNTPAEKFVDKICLKPKFKNLDPYGPPKLDEEPVGNFRFGNFRREVGCNDSAKFPKKGGKISPHLAKIFSKIEI